MSFADFAGLSDQLLDQSVDAGFIYLSLTQSALGLAVLWAAITLSADESTVEQKVYKNGLLLYLALTMMVSYSYLSIKTAAPIWYIFGVLLSSAAQSPAQTPMELIHKRGRRV